jgi:hypothetical protein
VPVPDNSGRQLRPDLPSSGQRTDQVNLAPLARVGVGFGKIGPEMATAALTSPQSGDGDQQGDERWVSGRTS